MAIRHAYLAELPPVTRGVRRASVPATIGKATIHTYETDHEMLDGRPMLLLQVLEYSDGVLEVYQDSGDLDLIPEEE